MATIGKAVFHQYLLLCFFIKSFPIISRKFSSGNRQLEIAIRHRVINISFAFKCSNQYINALCLIGITIIKAFEELQKDPLGPFVKFRIRSPDLAVPVETKTNIV